MTLNLIDMTTNEVWKLHSKDVKYFILSKVKDLSITDDLVQETFLKIHTKLHTLNDPNKIKSWVLSIARNTVFDYFKPTNISTEFDTNNLVFETIETEHTEMDCLKSHILNLDKKYQTPLFLSDIKGVKQSIIAKQLNLPLPTVKSRIQRARKKIAEGYMACCGYTLNEKGILVGEMQNLEDCKICN